jgi:prepilin-type N-terminal cleavage/methylation domain-containing protein
VAGVGIRHFFALVTGALAKTREIHRSSQELEESSQVDYGIYNNRHAQCCISPRKMAQIFFYKSESRKSENLPGCNRFLTGFSLLEVMFAVAIVALLSIGIITLLLQMNTYATAARLKTLATLAALNQVELLSTDAPFSPPDQQVPVELTIGNQTAPVIVYDDPNSNITVTGTMTTTVDDPNYWQNGYNLHLRRVTVTVAYVFRNRNYTVTMHTIRASDV